MSVRLFSCLVLLFLSPVSFGLAEDPAKSKKAEAKAPEKAVLKETKSPPKEEQNDTSRKEGAGKSDSVGQEGTTLVEKGEMIVREEISGVLQSVRNAPVKMDLLRWTDLLVLEAVPHGTEVKKGDVLVVLETKAIREKIEELEIGMPLKHLDLEMSETNLEKLKKTTPLSLAKARDAKMRAEEDFAYFEDVTRPMRERNAKEDVKQIREY
ncbi:MAG: hypothetical protein AAF733_12430, partial [Verrucomicrobiota bacterium]